MAEPNTQKCLKITGSNCLEAGKEQKEVRLYKMPFSYAKVSRICKF